MEIKALKTNHVVNPMGYQLDPVSVSWITECSTAKHQESAQVLVATDAAFAEVVYDSGRSQGISSLGHVLPLSLVPCTRYYWKVCVWADNGERAESGVAWFETGRMGRGFDASWIRAPFCQKKHPVFQKNFCLGKPVARARAYVTGLGLYELRINGLKVGEECLTPYYNDYNLWVQYQSYDVTELLAEGENAAGILLGNGWYKGRFGFVEGQEELYGDSFSCLCQIDVYYEDGTEESIVTDGSWLCGESPVLESSIYNGEVYDSRLEREGFATAAADLEGFVPAELADAPAGRLTERLSPPVKVMDTVQPEKLIHTPAGEWVVDFGQEFTGWVEFSCELPAGERLHLQFGEILQDGNFYTDNLRTAKQEYTYISDGKPAAGIRPHFTFYGLRYMLVEGLAEVCLEDFVGCVLYSELEQIGEIRTSDEKLNRLFLNALWGQRGNFLDVPTDCPQRDERMGWTGDAQVFCATASYNMETSAFYRKFLYDMRLEQRELGGAVPHVIPDVIGQVRRITHNEDSDFPAASCAWADAATVIPWTNYLFYGDKSLLAEEYENMAAWTDYILQQDEERCGGRRLWACGFHFADWLALDNPDKSSSFGGTDPYYVASAYYYYSAWLTAKAAGVLGKDEDAARYGRLSEEVKEAFRKEYFSADGKLLISTQTAMVLALHFGLAPEEYREALAAELREKLAANGNYLDTGFVGTAYLCKTLSGAGMPDLAYTLLLNEEYPSWLYEVKMGATTIWERWNSVLPDGHMSDTGMNSLNHYAYGAVVEWMYGHMAGIRPVEEAPGFVRAVIAPEADGRLSWVEASCRTAAGLYRSSWKREEDAVVYQVEVPFDAEAEFILATGAGNGAVLVNGEVCEKLQKDGRLHLEAGRYEIRKEA